MPFVVAEPCINCKYTDCVEVCPVDCFYDSMIKFFILDKVLSVFLSIRRHALTPPLALLQTKPPSDPKGASSTP